MLAVSGLVECLKKVVAVCVLHLAEKLILTLKYLAITIIVNLLKAIIVLF